MFIFTRESKLSNSKITPKLLEDLKEKVEKSWKFKDYKKYYWLVSLEKIENNFGDDVFIYSVEEFLNKK